MSDTRAALVSARWLADHLAAPDVVVVDGSWHLPGSGRDAFAEYRAGHIPSAVFFDLDAISDRSSPLPHMLPRPEAFASAVRKLGIGDGQTIVVYDTAGIYSAPRVWWMFRAMGAPNVFVLDGGLPAWIAIGGPLEEGLVTRPERHFTARLDHTLRAERGDVEAALASGSATVVDARAAGRFRGEVMEPRPGLRRGHMPGAVNVPYARLVNEDGTLKATDALGQAFAEAGVDLGRPAITTCGSGITAAILALALAELGHRATALYDGSWAEWGADERAPVVTGQG